jgi:hypothetical protein
MSKPMSTLKGVDVTVQIWDLVTTLLTKLNLFSEETVKKYAHFAVELYKYVNSHPQLQFALVESEETYKMARGAQESLEDANIMAKMINLKKLPVAARYARKGIVSSGEGISAFVNYFTGLLSHLGIKVDDCAVAVTEVILGVLIGVGMIGAGPEAWPAALFVLGFAVDAKDMKDKCLSDK